MSNTQTFRFRDYGGIMKSSLGLLQAMNCSLSHRLHSLIFLLPFVFLACRGTDPLLQPEGLAPQRNPKINSFALEAKKSNEVSAMTFNVENLFDEVDDDNVNDESYLPLALKKSPEHISKCSVLTNEFYKKECLELDWNEEVIDAKLDNVSQVLLQVDGGKGPDILFLQEVENLNILHRLKNQKLRKANYKTIALEQGFDRRGINVAILSKFPMIGRPILHKIPFQQPHQSISTRGILEVRLQSPEKREIVVFAVHFPSQSNSTETRKDAHRFLFQLMSQRPGAMVIAGGDFNTIQIEEKSQGYFSQIYDKSGFFHVSHIFGCQACPGTHYYKQTWDFLDVLIFSKNSRELGFEISPDRIDVLRGHPAHVDLNGIPQRFDPITLKGVSDHAPIYARFTELARPSRAR